MLNIRIDRKKNVTTFKLYFMLIYIYKLIFFKNPYLLLKSRTVSTDNLKQGHYRKLFF